MNKRIHIHLGAKKTRDSDDDGGRWVTIMGSHVHIGAHGKIDKGPAALVNKSEHEAHAHQHTQAATHHFATSEAKGSEHPDTKKHAGAYHEHMNAAKAYKDAAATEFAGDVKATKGHVSKAQGHAAAAKGHEDALAAPSKSDKVVSVSDKPKAHEKAHNAAAEAVKGSQQHEAEHKRLMGLYDKSSAPWERSAVTRLIEKNHVRANDHHATVSHAMAKTASDHAKQTGGIDHHETALKAIDDAIGKRAKAGPLGGPKGAMQELEGMKKHHQGKLDAHKKLAAEHVAKTNAMKAQAQGDAAKHHRAQAEQHRNPVGDYASPDPEMAALHDQKAEHHEAQAKGEDRSKQIGDLSQKIAQRQADVLSGKAKLAPPKAMQKKAPTEPVSMAKGDDHKTGAKSIPKPPGEHKPGEPGKPGTPGNTHDPAKKASNVLGEKDHGDGFGGPALKPGTKEQALNHGNHAVLHQDQANVAAKNGDKAAADSHMKASNLHFDAQSAHAEYQHGGTAKDLADAKKKSAAAYEASAAAKGKQGAGDQTSAKVLGELKGYAESGDKEKLAAMAKHPNSFVAKTAQRHLDELGAKEAKGSTTSSAHLAAHEHHSQKAKEAEAAGDKKLAGLHSDVAAHHHYMASNEGEDHGDRGKQVQDLNRAIKAHKPAGAAKPAPKPTGKAPSKPAKGPGGSAGVEGASQAVKGLKDLVKKAGDQADPDPKKQS